MKTVKVLYNTCYGGFSISKKAVIEFNFRHETNMKLHDLNKLDRHDSRLIEIFEAYGSEWFSDTSVSKIELIEITADGYKIHEKDGKEYVELCYADFILI